MSFSIVLLFYFIVKIVIVLIRHFFPKKKSFPISDKTNYPLFSEKNVAQRALTNEEMDILIRRIKQVIKWTEKLAADFDYNTNDYRKVFRQTNPKVNGLPAFDLNFEYPSWNIDDRDADSYRTLFKQAIAERDEADTIDLSAIDNLGRILTFQIGCTTCDGAPVAESKNYVDIADVPPIDTWICLRSWYYHGHEHCDEVLFCWVPKAFEPVMQGAIDVEILDSYRWLDENDTALYNAIKQG
ncbi:hypothetical protein CLV51_101733 [Chitinophaga niastensis]|uniref:Uncharacterized protein n=1 Tax=Chitinophaga niastensis TaxID=536980 RepID=A0A2P8HT45_CHINA|nr:hypothetical protein [Chitinophaga niastensis]PSL49401.1 hypothetical protein CLV51_101733 [Chitinophaga niastensis]